MIPANLRDHCLVIPSFFGEAKQLSAVFDAKVEEKKAEEEVEAKAEEKTEAKAEEKTAPTAS